MVRQWIVTIITQNKPKISSLNLVCKHKKMSLELNKQFIQESICSKIKRLDKCTWNPTGILIRDSKRREATIGTLTLLILGSEKFKRTLSINRSTKSCRLKDKTRISLKPNLWRAVWTISTLGRMINWVNLPISGKGSSLPIKSLA